MGASWHLAEGLSCLIESFRRELLSECCQAAFPALSSGSGFCSLVFRCSTYLSAGVYVRWWKHIIPICHKMNLSMSLTHVNVWQRTVLLICFWLEDNLMEHVTCMSPTPKYLLFSQYPKCLLCQLIINICNKLYVHAYTHMFVCINIGRFILDLFIEK